MTDANLTATSYAVLGLITRQGAMTPYDLKLAASESLGNFWSLQHAQLYREPRRLASLGLLTEAVENSGRRRHTFAITDAGRAAVSAWLAEPSTTHPDLHDPALVKLYFADLSSPEAVRSLALGQVERHRRRLAEYEATVAVLHDEPARRRVLRLGVRHERNLLGFWQDVADHPELDE